MSDHAPTDPAKVKRLQRLEETMKENLRRRKAQARARAEPAEDIGVVGDGDAPAEPD